MVGDRRAYWTREELLQDIEDQRKVDHLVSLEFWCATCQRCRVVSAKMLTEENGKLGGRCICGKRLEV